MRKLLMATGACALVIGLVAVPGASAVKSPKLVSGTVDVFVVPNPVPDTATTVTASGNVKANSSCRKDRTVHFTWVNTVSLAPTPLATTATTGSNGDYSVVLPKPTPPGTYVLQASVDFQVRKVGSKKKGKKAKNPKSRQFHCLQIPGQSSVVTALAPPTL
jgi:hypothetical protein